MAGAIALAATATPAVAGPLTLLTYIPVPADAANQQPGGAFSSFDISFADPVTGNIFIADRSNAAVDIFSGSSLTFLGRATGFTGQQATTSVSGPDGVLTVTSGGVTTLYAGDGNSTLKVFDATNPAAPVLQQSIFTNGTTRVDEMAYSSSTHQVLAANNAETPAYGNLFSTNNGHPPVALTTTPITVPAALGGIPGGGMEQPAWNPQTGTFFVSIPQLAGNPPNPNDPGGVAEISTAGQVLRTIDFTSFGIAACSPTGLAVSASGNMLVGCGKAGSQAVLLDKNGQLLATVNGLGGTDEIWYDPSTNRFYVTGNNGSNTTRFFDVVSDNGSVIQKVDLPTTTSAHSIAVDPFNGDVFVALAGTLAVDPCPTTQENPGCIAVFAPLAAVPEPGSLPLLMVGLAGLMGFAVRRRLQKSA
ncbi:MAG: PEP-CTERM sorting domain-containing protein [Alphaproteobacteria bacterium]